MALKDTLLAASLGATMIAGTNTEAKETVAPPITPQQMQTLSPAEIQEMNFQKNYRHLYKNVDGAWFSFGDQKELRDILYDIGSFSMGRQVIAGLPEGIKLGSTNFIFSYQKAGSYNARTNEVKINTRIMDEKNASLGTMKEFIFHELLHAYQKAQVVPKNLSVDECIYADKLGEAEAYAWNMVLTATQKCCGGKYHMTKEQAQQLMKRDIIEEIRSSKEKDIDTGIYEVHQLQQSLITCRGNPEKAQKHMVAQIMKSLMNGDELIMPGWNEVYDNQAIHNAKYYSESGQLTTRGNPQGFQKMMDYYQKQYGLTSKDVPLILTQEAQKQIDALKKQRGEITIFNKQRMSHRDNR